IHEMLISKIEISMDMYNGQLSKRDKKDAIIKWNKGQTHLMIATSAFGLVMNMNEYKRIWAKYVYFFRFSSLIQYFGRARRDQQESKCIILYSKKDIHKNYAIIVDNWERYYFHVLKVY
ncbi:hypothetical protein C2G38_1953000, partial [Gigaspora rosea]